MDNVRMDCSYLLLSLSLFDFELPAFNQIVFLPGCGGGEVQEFLLYISRLTSMLMEQPLLYLLARSVITAAPWLAKGKC